MITGSVYNKYKENDKSDLLCWNTSQKFTGNIHEGSSSHEDRIKRKQSALNSKRIYMLILDEYFN